MFDQPAARNVVGIENEHDFVVDQFHGVAQCRGLAAFARLPVKRPDTIGKTAGKIIDDLAGPVLGPIVDRQNEQAVHRVIHLQQSVE